MLISGESSFCSSRLPVFPAMSSAANRWTMAPLRLLRSCSSRPLPTSYISKRSWFSMNDAPMSSSTGAIAALSADPSVGVSGSTAASSGVPADFCGASAGGGGGSVAVQEMAPAFGHLAGEDGLMGAYLVRGVAPCFSAVRTVRRLRRMLRSRTLPGRYPARRRRFRRLECRCSSRRCAYANRPGPHTDTKRDPRFRYPGLPTSSRVHGATVQW